MANKQTKLGKKLKPTKLVPLTPKPKLVGVVATPRTDGAKAAALQAWSYPTPFPAEHFAIAKELELDLIRARRHHASDSDVGGRAMEERVVLHQQVEQLKFDLMKLAYEFAEYRKANPAPAPSGNM